jgi:hypothetical protein
MPTKGVKWELSSDGSKDLFFRQASVESYLHLQDLD